MQAKSERSSDHETILLVENEVLVRMVVGEFLRSCGYRVVEASDASEALLILQHAKIPVRIVLGGAVMPRSREGFALSRWIRAHKPGLQVILTASLSRTVDAAAKLCESGPTPKTNERDQVLARIRRLTAARATPGRTGRRTSAVLSSKQARLRLVAGR